MDTVQVQGIEQGNDIFGDLLDRVRAGGGRGLSVASRVVTQDAKLFSKRGILRVPHGKIGAEGIRERQDGRFARTFQCGMNASVSRLKDGHRDYSCPSGLLV